MVEKISEKMFKIINITEDKENSIFQTALSELKIKAEHLFVKKLPDYGQANRTDEQKKKHFTRLWVDSINRIFEIHIDNKRKQQIGKEVFDFSDDEVELDEGDSGFEVETIKTTLLNILLRKESSREHVQKIQTLIENGANKNLHEVLSSSPKMENQKEYPIYIILCEIDNPEKERGFWMSF